MRIPAPMPATLLQSQQYALAAEEYERLDFSAARTTTRSGQICSALYRRGDTPQRGLEQWAKWQLEPSAQKPACSTPSTPNSSLRGGYPGSRRASLVTESAMFDSTCKSEAHGVVRQYVGAKMARSPANPLEAIPSAEKLPRRADVEHLIQTRRTQSKKKKPWVATALSVPVPGLGKAYAGRMEGRHHQPVVRRASIPGRPSAASTKKAYRYLLGLDPQRLRALGSTPAIFMARTRPRAGKTKRNSTVCNMTRRLLFFLCWISAALFSARSNG
jgi:hypothetical protein